MATVLPAFEGYLSRFDRPVLDGGFYTKTEENRPLIGPTQVPGYYLLCALSGYGIMAAAAGGELLAKHVLGSALPTYSCALAPARFHDPRYLQALAEWQDHTQL
jgi:glycine/D-amino acid oxidase-like deaminating enzyme